MPLRACRAPCGYDRVSETPTEQVVHGDDADRSFDMSDSCWEIHSCGLLKKEASIVCHGASGEKLCCAKKQEHCCIYDEKPIKALFYSTLVVVIILGLFLILQCWRWSRPEPSPLRASPAAPPPEPEPVAAEIVPYPNR